MKASDGWKAIVLAGASLVFLLPAFNALNTSHIEGVDPPVVVEPPTYPTMPLPRDGPVPEPEEDGDRDDDLPPLPASCPPAVDVVKYHATFGEAPFQDDTSEIRVPPHTRALGIRVTYDAFVGQFTLTLSDARDTARWNESTNIIASGGPRSEAVEEVFPLPERGNWTVTWETSPTMVGGGSVDVALRLPCGGMFDDA